MSGRSKGGKGKGSGGAKTTSSAGVAPQEKEKGGQIVISPLPKEDVAPIYGKKGEETTATATGTESDSGGRDSESEEDDQALYGAADDDEEMLANKVVDKFLAGPIARATSQSIQDLLVSGHVKMSRRQR